MKDGFSWKAFCHRSDFALGPVTSPLPPPHCALPAPSLRLPGPRLGSRSWWVDRHCQRCRSPPSRATCLSPCVCFTSSAVTSAHVDPSPASAPSSPRSTGTHAHEHTHRLSAAETRASTYKWVTSHAVGTWVGSKALKFMTNTEWVTRTKVSRMFMLKITQGPSRPESGLLEST